MVQLGTPELATFAAWPENLLIDEPTGNVVGFLMPRVDGHREIHTLYGPMGRKTAFPDATWAFLVRAGRNVAAAFDTVHRHGHVIGDVNQGNVVVSRDATAQLIDCDSFQITHLGRTYPCRVGVPLFTPPELQGQRLDGVVRTPDHDRFGLAVLLFQLLFMGRHPFAGRHPERDINVETAIREGLFAFGWEAARQGWQPPPFSLRLKDVPYTLANQFERAFGRDAAAGGPRPPASEWITELDELEAETVTCVDDPRHVHAGRGSCPWCRIEKEGGPSFFFLPPGAAEDAFDLPAAWHAIEGVRSPDRPAFPGPPPGPRIHRRVTAALLHAVVRWRYAIVAASLVLGALLVLLGMPVGYLGLLGLLALWPRGTLQPVQQRLRAIAAGEEGLRRLEGMWLEECGDGAFTRRRRELREAKIALEGLPAVENREWTALAERFRGVHLQRHLAGFALEFSRIPGLGAGELETLNRSGVTSAADITAERLMAIPDIDLDLVRALLTFKAVATRSFAFDPGSGIPGMHQKALAERQTKRREELKKTVQMGAVDLVELRHQAIGRREELTPMIEEFHRQLAGLRANTGRAQEIAISSDPESAGREAAP
jgi:DNA-binding helix-hairpin-helix protein with protein kinase domain